MATRARAPSSVLRPYLSDPVPPGLTRPPPRRTAPPRGSSGGPGTLGSDAPFPSPRFNLVLQRPSRRAPRAARLSRCLRPRSKARPFQDLEGGVGLRRGEEAGPRPRLLPRCHGNRVTWQPRPAPGEGAGSPGVQSCELGGGLAAGTWALRPALRTPFPLQTPSPTSSLHFKGGETEARGPNARARERRRNQKQGPLLPSRCCPGSQHKGGPTGRTSGPRRPQLEATRRGR